MASNLFSHSVRKLNPLVLSFSLPLSSNSKIVTHHAKKKGLDLFLDSHMPHLPHSLPPHITLPSLPLWPVN